MTIRKNARYESHTADIEQIEAEDGVFQRWRKTIHPDALKILFQAGYKTDRALHTAGPDALSVAAKFLGVTLKPGVEHEWKSYIEEYNNDFDEYSEDDLADEISKHNSDEDDDGDSEQGISEFGLEEWPFDPKLCKEKYTTCLELLDETKVCFSMDRQKPAQPHEPSDMGSSLTFQTAGRTWQLRVAPRRASSYRNHTFSFTLALLPPIVWNAQHEKKLGDGYPVNFVVQIENEARTMRYENEAHVVYKDEPAHRYVGRVVNFENENSLGDREDECYDEMSVMLFFRCYKYAHIATKWDAATWQPFLTKSTPV